MDRSIKLDSLNIDEVPAEPDEMKAIEEAKADRENNGTIPHDAINWN